MRKSRYSDEEIADTVRQAEAGALVADIVRKLGISEATFHAWKKRIDRLRTHAAPLLRDENAQLVAQISDLMSNRQTCKTCAPSASSAAYREDERMREFPNSSGALKISKTSRKPN